MKSFCSAGQEKRVKKKKKSNNNIAKNMGI